jgi:parvulin-like peptidyl-prolyl isomerase
MPKPILGLLTAAILVSVVNAQNPTPSYIDGILALINDEVITVYDVASRNLVAEREILSRFNGAALKDPAARERIQKLITESRRDVVTHLINEKLIYAEYTAKGYQLPGGLVDKRIDDLVRQQHQGDWQALDEWLVMTETTMNEFRDSIERNLAGDVMLNQAVYRKIRVTDSAIERYYNDHLADYTKAAKLRLQLISVRNESKIDYVMKELQDGTDFGELAKQYSAHGSSTKGGDLGMMAAGDMAPLFRQAFKSLSVGSISKPFEHSGKFVVLRVAEIEGAEIRPLAEVDEKIRGGLRSRQRKILRQQYVDGLRSQNYIKVFFKEKR